MNMCLAAARSRRRAHGGFTLVEATVVLVVLALLSVVSFVAYSTLVARANTQSLMTTGLSIDHAAAALAAHDGSSPAASVAAVLDDPGGQFHRTNPVAARTPMAVLPAASTLRAAATTAAPLPGTTWGKAGVQVELNTVGGYILTRAGAGAVCYLPPDFIGEPGTVRELDGRGCDASDRTGATKGGGTLFGNPFPYDPYAGGITVVPATSLGPDPFIADPPPMETVADPIPLVPATVDVANPPPGNTTPSTVEAPATIELSDPQPQVYAAPSDADRRLCGTDRLARILKQDSKKGKAWASAVGIDEAAIEPFIADLAPVQLLRDVRITDHGFDGAGFTSFQAMLKAGDVVLVDSTGAPRARCRCGNPLASPNTMVPAEYNGNRDFSGNPVYLNPRMPQAGPGCVLNVVDLSDPTDPAGVDITSGGAVAVTPQETPWCPGNSANANAGGNGNGNGAQAAPSPAPTATATTTPTPTPTTAAPGNSGNPNAGGAKK